MELERKALWRAKEDDLNSLMIFNEFGDISNIYTSRAPINSNFPTLARRLQRTKTFEATCRCGIII